MKTFQNSCAQGDVMIQRVAKLPKGLVENASQEGGANLIVTHSETGHHHVMDRASVTMFDNPDNALEGFLQVHRATQLSHLRPHDTHESIAFDPGVYRIIRQREYTPEGFRRVAD